MRGKILLLFLLSFIVLSSLAFSVDIDECYGFSENSTLTQNIYGDNTCMIAWADDITLDCDGYKITHQIKAQNLSIHLYMIILQHRDGELK